MGWRATESQFLIQCLQLPQLVSGGKRHLARSAPVGAAPPVLLEWVWKIKLGEQGRLGAPQFHGWPGQAEFQWESAPGRAGRGLYRDLTRQRIRVVLSIKGASISRGWQRFHPQISMEIPENPQHFLSPS